VRILLISAANDAGSIVPLPLGLACVAAATERAGHRVRLLALGSDADCENDVRRAIKQFAPDVIGISVRNIDDQNMQSPRFLLGSLKQVVAACRAASSSRIVLGGAGYSIFPESALEYLGGDMGIRGEGETAFRHCSHGLSKALNLHRRLPCISLMARTRPRHSHPVSMIFFCLSRDSG